MKTKIKSEVEMSMLLQPIKDERFYILSHGLEIAFARLGMPTKVKVYSRKDKEGWIAFKITKRETK